VTSRPASTKARPAPKARFAFVVVPLDGSAFAEQAIPAATALASQAGRQGRIELVHVHDLGTYAANARQIDPGLENERAREMNVDLGVVAKRLALETNLRVTSVTLRGRTAQVLAQHVVDSGADVLVMTTHGRSGMKRAFVGSVTEQVLRIAKAPVLVVPSRASDR
jgi:nucleotide-binding universal stress UspA family protein